jgi:lysophospholipase L1-like esterase
MTILIFGDSITFGAWDHEGGWVARLRKIADKKTIASEGSYYRKIYNLGISGDKTTEVLVRFEQEAKARLKEGEECAVIFAIGTNDSQYLLEQNVHRTSPEDFEKNIRQLIVRARALTSRILFVGLLPVEDDKVDPIPWAPTKAYRTTFIAQYHAIIARICKAEKVDFVDVFSLFSGEAIDSLFVDGVHPNDEGHKKVFGMIHDALVTLGWI